MHFDTSKETITMEVPMRVKSFEKRKLIKCVWLLLPKKEKTVADYFYNKKMMDRLCKMTFAELDDLAQTLREEKTW